MQKREAQQLIEMLENGKVESVMYLLRGVVSDYEGEQAAAKEQQEYEEMSDADKAAYDSYHDDPRGWDTRKEREEQLREVTDGRV